MNLTVKLRRAAGLDEREANALNAILDTPAAEKALRDYDARQAAERDKLIEARLKVDADEIRELKGVIAAREAADEKVRAAQAAVEAALNEARDVRMRERTVRNRADITRARIDRELRDFPVAELIAEWRKELSEMLEAAREFRPTTMFEDDRKNLLGQPIGRLLSNKPSLERHREALREEWNNLDSLHLVPSAEVERAIERRRAAIPPLSTELEEWKR